MSPRQIVAALALLDLLAWIVAVSTHIGGNVPARPYVIFGLALEVLVLVGLWFMWRVAWLVAVVGEVLGAVFEVAHLVEDGSSRRVVLLTLGLVNLALLMSYGAKVRSLRRAKLA